MLGDEQFMQSQGGREIFIYRMVVSNFTLAAPNVWLPTDEIGVTQLPELHRQTIHIAKSVVNDPPISRSDFFKLSWPANVKSVQDDRTGRILKLQPTTEGTEGL